MTGDGSAKGQAQGRKASLREALMGAGQQAQSKNVDNEAVSSSVVDIPSSSSSTSSSTSSSKDQQDLHQKTRRSIEEQLAQEQLEDGGEGMQGSSSDVKKGADDGSSEADGSDSDDNDAEPTLLELHIGVGTYEHALYGYDCQCVLAHDSPTAVVSAKLTKQYVFEAHSAQVTAIASGGPLLASGSFDEQIKIYNIKKKVEIGLLQLHKGTITCMQFHEQACLLTAGEDGIICVWDTAEWTNMKTLKGHKGSVRSFAIHPSGKMALSVGADKTLRLWNLLTGRCAYVTNRKQAADLVLWAPDGSKYVIVTDKKIEVIDMSDNEVVCAFDSNHHITSAAFIAGDLLAFGGFSETLFIVNTATAEAVCSFNAHETRIKGICAGPMSEDYTTPVVATADSHGFVKVWSCDDLLGATDMDEVIPVAAVNTRSLVTSLTVCSPNASSTAKKTALRRMKKIVNQQHATAASRAQNVKGAKADKAGKGNHGKPKGKKTKAANGGFEEVEGPLSSHPRKQASGKGALKRDEKAPAKTARKVAQSMAKQLQDTAPHKSRHGKKRHPVQQGKGKGKSNSTALVAPDRKPSGKRAAGHKPTQQQKRSKKSRGSLKKKTTG